MELHDIRSLGSSFTWFKPNGRAKSRLDRFLVSDQWLSMWPNTYQHVLQRDFSDHCPLILKTNMVDWGPKPFRVVDWWLNQKGYHSMVKEAWTADQQGGWGGIALKNKLRSLRQSIKQWSKEEGLQRFVHSASVCESSNFLENCEIGDEQRGVGCSRELLRR